MFSKMKSCEGESVFTDKFSQETVASAAGSNKRQALINYLKKIYNKIQNLYSFLSIFFTNLSLIYLVIVLWQDRYACVNFVFYHFRISQ